MEKAAENGTLEQETTLFDVRQPENSAGTDMENEQKGQPETVEQGGELSKGEGLPDGWTPETGLKLYKDLQREFGKQAETNKQLKDVVTKLDKFGGAEYVIQTAQKLIENPEFKALVQSQEAKSKYGIDMAELDDETKNALSLVRNIAASIVDEKINAIRRTEIEPLSKSAMEKTLLGHFAQLDKQYGADLWRPFIADMKELLPKMPDKAFNNVQFEDIDDLFWKAVRAKGAMENIAAKLYEKKITEKKKKASDAPSATATGGPMKAKVKNMSEAFANAKKELKM